MIFLKKYEFIKKKLNKLKNIEFGKKNQNKIFYKTKKL